MANSVLFFVYVHVLFMCEYIPIYTRTFLHLYTERCPVSARGHLSSSLLALAHVRSFTKARALMCASVSVCVLFSDAFWRVIIARGELSREPEDLCLTAHRAYHAITPDV